MSSPSRPIACTACSRAKTKCDKLIPTCSRCKSRRMVCEPRTAGLHNTSGHSSRASSNPLDASMQRQMTSFYPNQRPELAATRTLSSQSGHYEGAASNSLWTSSSHPLETCRMPAYYAPATSEASYLDMDLVMDSSLDLDCGNALGGAFSASSHHGQMPGYLATAEYTGASTASGYSIISHCGPGDTYSGYVPAGGSVGNIYGNPAISPGYATASPALEHSKANAYPYMETKGNYQ